MLTNFFGQPVNFTISSAFILSFGLVATSIVLHNADLPDPVTGLGAVITYLVLEMIYGAGNSTHLFS